ncbi:renalase isoform X2 [Salarias fasciatus]|uniref:renalase isoform X2 n=1 Tax=Salarias fasciatus TaxID=181472 RepID=UPI001177051D|nr:renalase-like isoform X2 [Salarias fasciatus]
MSRVLIVGAGLTGSLCACLLRRELQSKVHIVVWDKSRGAGGRMSTSRSPDPSSHPADLGAQYISATPAYAQSHQSFYSELLAAGVLKPLDCIIEGLKQKDISYNYVTPLGMSSLVKHFLSESGADLFLERHVTGVYRRGASWEVKRKVGESETFDAVVLTMPVPQILQLEGDVGPCESIKHTHSRHTCCLSSRSSSWMVSHIRPASPSLFSSLRTPSSAFRGAPDTSPRATASATSPWTPGNADQIPPAAARPWSSTPASRLAWSTWRRTRRRSSRSSCRSSTSCSPICLSQSASSATSGGTPRC